MRATFNIEFESYDSYYALREYLNDLMDKGQVLDWDGEGGMTDELEPCPFCGGTAHVEHACNGGRRMLYWVGCEGCYARSQSYFDNPHGAIESWNRRVKE